MKSEVSVRSTVIIVGLYKALFTDLCLDVRDYRTFEKRILQEGVAFATRTLPLLDKALLQGLEEGTFSPPSNFKRSPSRSAIPAFCGSLFRKVFHNDGRLLDRPCHASISALRQIFGLVYKSKSPCKPALHEQVIEGFVSTEAELQTSVITTNPQLLDLAATYIGIVFRDYKKEDLLGRHGPGITSESRNPRDSYGRKNRAPRGKDSCRIYASSSESRLGHLMSVGSGDYGTSDEFLSRVKPSSTQGLFKASVDGFHASVLLVPKDSRGPRIISCEPAVQQFKQQALMGYMVDRLERHPWTSGNINFTDQSINAGLALKASVSREWATLDLKDASDRISVRLVNKLFKFAPDLLKDLLGTRTSHTKLPDGRLIFLRKFAPMGSATCFPTLATCCYFPLVAALNVLTGYPCFDLVKVYGDDIMVKTEFFNLAVSVLVSMGLAVNTSKSFHKGYFRESCGMDAYQGTDVTPVRFRAVPGSFSAMNLVSILATANQLYKNRLIESAELLYRLVEAVLGRLPYGSEKSPYLCRVNPELVEKELIPEANCLQSGVRWKWGESIDSNPLGGSVRAWTLKNKDQLLDETGYERLMRVLPVMGLELDDLPIFGYFPRRKSTTLVRGRFNHYAQA